MTCFPCRWDFFFMNNKRVLHSCDAEDVDRVKEGSTGSSSFLTTYFKTLKHNRGREHYLHNAATSFHLRSSNYWQLRHIVKMNMATLAAFCLIEEHIYEDLKTKMEDREPIIILPLTLKLSHRSKSLSKSSKFIKANDPQYCLWRIYCCLCTSVTSYLGRQLTMTRTA